ncbi:hypothetical protein Nepgr_003311 [Nepenthes gracilis]|uniref:Uncharacterized protein n=1 Tax=Nepenthes gracilis TaxID=150966 RepID=A0AAD3RZE2_NEPGR|nr:hypothetical protein Nepgr_003311 [Nepenthes gracilis]
MQIPQEDFVEAIIVERKRWKGKFGTQETFKGAERRSVCPLLIGVVNAFRDPETSSEIQSNHLRLDFQKACFTGAKLASLVIVFANTA